MIMSNFCLILKILTLFKFSVASIDCNIPGSFPLPYNSDWTITSDYGYRVHPTLGGLKKHRGIDIAADSNTFVVASGCGYIDDVNTDKSLGNYIKIKHSYSYESLYGHLSEGYVKKGQCISVGDTIGKVGTTGRSTGNHLHYQINFKGKAIDPKEYLFLHYKENIIE